MGQKLEGAFEPYQWQAPTRLPGPQGEWAFPWGARSAVPLCNGRRRQLARTRERRRERGLYLGLSFRLVTNLKHVGYVGVRRLGRAVDKAGGETYTTLGCARVEQRAGSLLAAPVPCHGTRAGRR